MARTKGAKNKHYKLVSEAGKSVTFRIDLDILDFLTSQKNRNRYVNNLIRKDMEKELEEMEKRI